MADSKKVFFGSFVEFSSAGAEELIHEFCASLSDRNSAPFITYDKIHKIFSCEVDHNDSHLIEGFIAQFHAYVEFHHIKKSDDLVESSPRLRPVAGTTTQDDITEAKLLTASLEANFDPMLIYGGESDDSDDETSPLGHAVTYWTPKDGDVNILTTGIAEQIANLTGCHLFAEPSERRVRLVNGDLKAALTKLQQLEPILSRTAKHHLESESKVDGNVVTTRSDKLGTLIKFARLQYPHCGFHRVMVGADTHKKLHQSFLTELRIWEDGECIKPPNLDLEGVSISEVPGPSRLFQDARMPAFGNPARAQAQVRSNPDSLLSANEQTQAGPSKFMGARNALRVTEWTKAVDPEANPEMPPPEPLPELDAPVRRRIVVEDSSDEEEDEAPPPPKKEATVEVPPPTTPFSRASQGTGALIHSHASAGRKIVEINSVHTQPKQVNKPFMSRNVFDLLGSDDNDQNEEHPDQESDAASMLHEIPEKALSNDAILIDVRSQVHSKSPEDSKINQKTVRIDEHLQSPRKHHLTPTRMGYHNGMAGPVPPLPRPVSRGMSPPPRPHASGSRDARGSGRGVTQQQQPFHGSSNQTQHNRLVDTSTTPSTQQVLSPPPGFEYRTNLIRRSINEGSTITPDTHGLTSVITPSPELSDQTGSSSVPSAEASNPGRNPFGYSPQYSVPKRNIRFMQEEAAIRLREEMQHHKVTKGSQVDGANDEEMPPERLQIVDESRSRRLHQIMHQQAGKTARPAKGKGKGNGNNAKQETKKEKEERIRKAMSEAHGALPPPQAKPKSDAPSEKMSSKKKALIKSNPEMAALHPDELQKNAFEDQVQRFRTELEPLFEDSRAYPGQVCFELQIGQAFVLRHDRINEQMLYKLRDWYQLFSNTNQSAASVMFTNLVTINGLDIDRVLDLQLPGSTSDLWNKQKPVFPAIAYEFVCLDKSGAEFVVNIDQSAKHRLGKSRATLGKVAIHCPGQIWDACAVLSGSREWLDAPTDLVRDVAQFVDELYIPDHPGKASVYYRLPVTNTFTIRHIEVKSTSIFDCLDPNKVEFQLQVIEAKSLIHSSHPVDKKLFRSHDLSYQDMIEKARLHYEVSIIHKGINKAFLENETLEVGELTSAERTGKSLITTAMSRQTIGLISHIVECIDWLGAANTGTLKRLEEENQLYQRTINAGLPPQALTQVGRAMPLQTGTVIHTATSPSGPRTIIPGSNVVTGTSTVGGLNESRFVPGVRAGTNADLYQQDGQLFYYGVGGAKIPVIPSEIPGLQELNMNVSREPLMPQDSASQIGTSRIVRQGLGIAGTHGRNPHDNKPAGFW